MAERRALLITDRPDGTMSPGMREVLEMSLTPEERALPVHTVVVRHSSRQEDPVETKSAPVYQSIEQIQAFVSRAVDTLLRLKQHAQLTAEALVSWTTTHYSWYCSDLMEHPPRAGWMRNPTLAGLQEECIPQHCCCAAPLRLISVAISGSSLTRVHHKLPGTGIYDLDMMYELGPVEWQTFHSTGPEPEAYSSGAAPMVLQLTRTPHPGFFQIRRRPGANCPHTVWPILSSRDIRQLIRQLLMMTEPETEIVISGPAIRRTLSFPPRSCNIVPCLQLPQWPNRDVFARLRRLDWLPISALHDIEQGGLHLVPVGCPGSQSDTSEWRLSFSRAEAILLLSLPPVQERVMKTLLMCRDQMGLRKVVKTYYLQSALLWLGLEMRLTEWTNVMESAARVLNWLQKAVLAGRLPCFCLSSMNVLSALTEARCAELTKAIVVMHRNLTSLVLKFWAQEFPSLICPAAHQLHHTYKISEDQLRVCLVRGMIVCKCISLVQEANGFQLAARNTKAGKTLLRPGLMASFQDQAAHVIKDLRRQWRCTLLEAARVAPGHVLDRMRLTRTSATSWEWDAAPLVQLLTDHDLNEILIGNKQLALCWCDTQNRLSIERRIPGMPADPRSPHGLLQLLSNLAALCNLQMKDSAFATACRKTEATLRTQYSKTITFEELHEMITSLPVVGEYYHFACHQLRLDSEAAARFAERCQDHTIRQWEADDARGQFRRQYTNTAHPWGIDCYLHRMI